MRTEPTDAPMNDIDRRVWADRTVPANDKRGGHPQDLSMEMDDGNERQD